MVASRQPRISPTGLAGGGPAPATPPARRNLMIGLAVMVPAILLALAWFDGGEKALRPIAEPVALPGQAQ